MIPKRVWVSRDSDTGQKTWLWNEKPVLCEDGEYISGIDGGVQGGMETFDMGMRPGQCREFILTPVTGKKGRAKK